VFTFGQYQVWKKIKLLNSIKKCITNTSKIAPLRSAGPPYAALQSALYVGVLLTPKSGLYSLKVGMSAIGTQTIFTMSDLRTFDFS
jgi:hypothetical protein